MSILLADAKSRLLGRHAELTRLRAHHSEQQRALDASDELDWPDRCCIDCQA